MKEKPKNTSENTDDTNDDINDEPHYDTEDGYGYNRSDIVFPILDNETQEAAFEKRQDG